MIHILTISEDQFQEIDSCANELYLFWESDVIPVFLEEAKSYIEGKPKDQVLKRARYLLAHDMAYCYNGLGVGLDFAKPESVALLFIIGSISGKTFAYDELDARFLLVQSQASTFSPVYDELLKNSFLKKNIEIASGAALLMKRPELLSKYVILLYRFTSLIAKIDGEVTSKEVEWLNTIMSWKSFGKEGGNEFQTRAGINENVSAVDQLFELIGLESVKQQVLTLRNYITIQKVRENKGLKSANVSYHCVFLGNPGTGKTTVARIVAQIYKELGVLKSGHLVETDRSGLVAEYVGQTAVKTNKIIDSALDGVLFIDEAYSLVDGGNADYGKEAIATLVKRMEDDRDRLVVILAGYKEEMGRFLNSNSGLQSRFSRIIDFPDYSAEELCQIFESNCKKFDYTMSASCSEKLSALLNDAVVNKDKGFGNARFVRNLFEKTIENQANRLSKQGSLNKEILSRIEKEDLI